MKIQYEILEDDLLNLQALHARLWKIKSKKNVWLLALKIALVLSATLAMGEGVGLLAKYGEGRFAADLKWVLWPIFVCYVAFILYSREVKKYARLLYKEAIGPLPLMQTLDTSESGLTVEDRYGRVYFPWSSFLAFLSFEQNFFFTVTGTPRIIIPFRAFGSDEERIQFEKDIRSNMERTVPESAAHGESK